MSFENFINELLAWFTSSGIRLIFTLILFSIGWKLIKKVKKVFNKFCNKKSFDSTLQTFLSAFIDLTLKAILIVSLLQFLGLELTGFAAILASSTLAIGLALQGSLSNFAGGVIILIMRPFNVGDYIEVQGYSGTVEKIELVYTHLLTPDNKVVMIPNGNLANSNLVNYTLKDTRRVDLVFGVGYSDDILHVKRILMNIIENNELILSEPKPFINISEHASSSVNLAVRVWTNTENYWNVYFYLIEEAKLKFDEEKISIPYPQMDVHIKEK